MTTENVENRLTRIEAVLEQHEKRIGDANQSTNSHFTALREDISNVRTQLHQDINDVRTELHDSISDVRTELHDSISDVRTEIHDSISDVRVEIRTMFWRLFSILIVMILAMLGGFISILTNLPD